MEELSKQQIKHYIIVNLSYNLTHKLLKEKIYSQIIRNITEHIISVNNINTKHFVKAIINNANRNNLLYSLLCDSFVWGKTPEEFKYWYNLYRKYLYENY